MAKKNPLEIRESKTDPFGRLAPTEYAKAIKGCQHVYRNGYRCATDEIGHATPQGKTPATLVIDATEGFIPLWGKDVTLRWRFNETSFRQFARPESAKKAVRGLMGKALLLWGDSVPVKFTERADAWDFEVVVQENDDCNTSGCTLAMAFFPDQGRHKLFIYPKSFQQSIEEQVETLAHEFGHVFGLRHFFAKLSETAWGSEIFGDHNPFSIMNYGDKSSMTEQDKSDLKLLYSMVWSGALKEINGTRIRLVQPFHTL